MPMTPQQIARKKMEQMIRRSQIVESLLAGMSESEIAGALKISRSTVQRDILFAKQLITEKMRDDMMQNVMESNARLLKAIQLIYPIINGSFKFSEDATQSAKLDRQFAAVDKLVAIEARRARLLGLDAPEYLRLNECSTEDLMANAIFDTMKGEGAPEPPTGTNREE